MVVSQIHFADEITLFAAYNYFSSGGVGGARGAEARSLFLSGAYMVGLTHAAIKHTPHEIDLDIFFDFEKK